MNLALMDWRNTPGENLDSSPAQRTFGHRTRTPLPTSVTLLQPKLPENVAHKLKTQKSKQSEYFNVGAEELGELAVGDRVRIKPHKATERGAVVEDKVGIRSYLVRTVDGQVYRRDRRHLRKSKERDSEPELDASSEPDLDVSVLPNLPSNVSLPSQLAHVPAFHDPQVGMQNHWAAAAFNIPSDGIPRDGSGLENIGTSRSSRGRTIRRPQKLKDFVT